MTESSSPSVPLVDSYWVISGKLLAGKYPYSHDELEGTKKLSHLLQSGIHSIADLTMPGEAFPYFDELIQLADEMDVQMSYSRFAIGHGNTGN